MPAEATPKGAFTSVEDLFRDGGKQRTVLDRIDENEVIRKDQVTGFGEAATVASLLKPGMRAHTLPVDPKASVAGFLFPGSVIDIYLTYNGPTGQRTKLLLEKVEIIAVDQTTDRDTIKARVARTITLEVTPEDSQRLILAERIGQLSFNMRGLSDDSAAGTTLADVGLSVSNLLGVEERSPQRRAEGEVRVNRGIGNLASKDGALELAQPRPRSDEANRDRFSAAAPRALSKNAASEPAILPPAREDGRERHPGYAENPVKSVAAEPVSTFSIDVDTASYAFVRASLMDGQLPAAEAVRVEELINYFPYDYAPPTDEETPFATHVSVYPAPWKPTNRLVHSGIKGFELAPGERPRANQGFLIDTSGSMAAQNKLPLLLQSFRLMLSALDPEDTVAIVAYAGSAGVVLEPTKVGESRKILAALDKLHSGGSTAGGQGLALAYALAEENFDAKGVNRVILATDGDFNVGVSDPERLKTFVAEKRKTGVGLSVLGFGRGNYNDTLMQTLAQNGDGNAAYIDTLSEAQKVMVEETSSTLFTIARDVKIQVEWNPATVSEYRLIGYETRALNREDFNNDKVDAGEIGAGHSVTAIYEITPVGAPGSVDPLRYSAAEEAVTPAAASSAEYGFLKMRYKLPGEDESRLITRPILVQEVLGELRAASTEAQFATAVAGFGQLLRGGAQTGGFDYDDVIALSQSGRGADPYGYRAEFTRLVKLAQSIAGRSAGGIKPTE
jgi:Ca-activated chloride channel family protein